MLHDRADLLYDRTVALDCCNGRGGEVDDISERLADIRGCRQQVFAIGALSPGPDSSEE